MLPSRRSYRASLIAWPAVAEQPPTRALFVRIPQAHAQALDRLAFESRRPKQAVVTELLGRYIGDPAGRPASARRITIEAGPEPGTVIGRHAFRPFEPDVLTLEEAAALLSVSAEAVRELAESGELPGRRIASEWRFARAAVLEWLAGGTAAGAG